MGEGEEDDEAALDRLLAEYGFRPSPRRKARDDEGLPDWGDDDLTGWG